MMPSPMTWLTVPSKRWTASIIRSSTGSSIAARLLGVALGEQLERPLEIGEQDGDVLSLSQERLPELRILSARWRGV